MKPGIALFIVIAGIFSAVSEADDQFQAHWYAGANIGTTKTNWKEGGQDFSYRSVGGSFGYQFNEIFGIEVFTSSATSSAPEEILSPLLGTDVYTSFDAMGAFLTAKTTGKAYLKARAGLVESNFAYSASGFQTEKNSDVGLAFGLAGGAKFEKVRFELGYMLLPDVADPLPFFDGQIYESSLLNLSIYYDFQ